MQAIMIICVRSAAAKMEAGRQADRQAGRHAGRQGRQAVDHEHNLMTLDEHD